MAYPAEERMRLRRQMFHSLIPQPDMGAVFAFASATINIAWVRPEAVATGMRITFAVAAILIVITLAIAVGTYRCTSCSGDCSKSRVARRQVRFGMTSRRLNSLAIDLQDKV